MARSGRPRVGPREQINFRCPPDLKDKVLERLKDPVYNKTKQGSLSELIVYLLAQWVGSDKLEDL